MLYEEWEIPDRGVSVDFLLCDPSLLLESSFVFLCLVLIPSRRSAEFQS